MVRRQRRNQRADTDNRVVDVLWKFIPEFCPNFVLGFAIVTIRRSKACEVRHRFNIPYESVRHVRRSPHIAAEQEDFLAPDTLMAI
jgi:hypothetical protein